MDKDKEQEEKRQTPIVDGDARPDIPSNPEDAGSPTEKDSRKKENRNPGKTGNKFESERQSDLNSLEDYKDAK